MRANSRLSAQRDVIYKGEVTTSNPTPARASDSAHPHAAQGRSIAYLVSRYPTLSMIFVLREVLALREMGFRIETASINPPDRPPEKLTAQERDEANRTYCVKCHGAPGAAAAFLKTLATNLPGLFRGLSLAFRLAGLDIPKLFLNLMYFVEALMVGQWMRRNGQTHLHVHLASQAASVGLFAHRIFGYGYSLTVHGPDEQSLQECAARLQSPNTVLFEGAVNQDRIRNFYAMADVFCLPSFAEGLPVVLMEAMAMQVPCVSTTITGIPELIRTEIDGLLVPPSDVDALTIALQRLMDDADLRKRLAASGRTRVLEQYDLAANVEMLATVFTNHIQ